MSLIHHRIADVLREAGEDGLTLSEIAEACSDRQQERVGLDWWEDRIAEMRRDRTYVISEWHGVYCLIAERGVERASRPTDGGQQFVPAAAPAEDSARSLSAGRLFDDEVPSAYREAA